jgi:hypothetical protein
MAHQERIVGGGEATRILAVTKAELRRTVGSKNTYWSPKLGWISVTKLGPMAYKVEWDGTADCGC